MSDDIKKFWVKKNDLSGRRYQKGIFRYDPINEDSENVTDDAGGNISEIAKGGIEAFSSDIFDTVSTVIRDGRIWYSRNEICDALGITNGYRLMKILDEDESIQVLCEPEDNSVVEDNIRISEKEENSETRYTTECFVAPSNLMGQHDSDKRADSRRKYKCFISRSAVSALIRHAKDKDIRKAARRWMDREIMESVLDTGQYSVVDQRRNSAFDMSKLPDPEMLRQLATNIEQTKILIEEMTDTLNDVIQERDDEANRNGRIESRARATAMSTASNEKRKTSSYEDNLGIGKNYVSIGNIKWLENRFRFSELPKKDRTRLRQTFTYSISKFFRDRSDFGFKIKKSTVLPGASSRMNLFPVDGIKEFINFYNSGGGTKLLHSMEFMPQLKLPFGENQFDKIPF